MRPSTPLPSFPAVFLSSSLPIILFLLFTPLAPATRAHDLSDHCFRRRDHDSSILEILPVHGPCSPFLQPTSSPLSWEDTLLQMQSQDQARLQYLSSSLVAGKSSVPIASGRQIIQSPSYIVRVKLGTPPQTLFMMVDTSNDAALVPCADCVGCGAGPGSASFDPAKSSSFQDVSCEAAQCSQVRNPTCGASSSCTFNLTYGSSTISALLSQDTISLAADTVPRYTYGCISKATGTSLPPQGLLGLGRGPLSFMSQTQSIYQSTFSYCLPSFSSFNFSGSLRLGPVSQPQNIKFTPLLRNLRRSTFYYVNLVAIRVGRRVVDIPKSAFDFDPNTGAGTIFDSGTMFTRLVEPAYNAVRDEVRRRMGNGTVSSLGGFDTCYSLPFTAIPTITFMFQGMNMTLAQDNFLIHSKSTSLSCLAMAAAPADNVNSVLNVIANMQQQNHRILFDVPNSRLGVSRELCTT